MVRSGYIWLGILWVLRRGVVYELAYHVCLVCVCAEDMKLSY